jgi:hypothetical protein
MVNRYNYGQIWSIPCPSTSATVIQTTACSSSIPSPTGANPFLVPNARMTILSELEKKLTSCGIRRHPVPFPSRLIHLAVRQLQLLLVSRNYLSRLKIRMYLTSEQIKFPTRAPLIGLLRLISRAPQVYIRNCRWCHPTSHQHFTGYQRITPILWDCVFEC